MKMAWIFPMMFARLLGATWLGHGRVAEAMLTLVAGLWGILLLVNPETATDSKATVDLAWEGYGHIIAAPLLLKASLTGIGLIGNVKGWSSSRYFRFCGALLGSFIWGWLIGKFWAVGVPFTFGVVCALAFFLLSIRVAGMSLADLPRPGTPGSNGTC